MATASTLFSVPGLVALITGGGTGIGLMIAKALDANGAAAVYIVGRRREPLEAAAASAVNKTIIPVVGDVTSRDSLKAIAAKVKEEHGFLNVVFANSGITGPSSAGALKAAGREKEKASVEEWADAMFAVPMEDFTNAMHVNVTAMYYTVLAFMGLLDAGNKRGNVSQKSQVVVITSIAAYNRVSKVGFAYNASKAAANQLVKVLSTEFNKWDIRINGIAPGMFPSELTEGMIPSGEEGKKPWENGGVPKGFIPLGRTGGEDDMMGIALFLTSKAGAFVNGNVLVTDGGALTMVPNSY